MVEELTKTEIELINVSMGYHDRVVLSDVNLKLKSGEITCLLGPNGVGKTTLFKTLLGFLPPISGHVVINGKSIDRLLPKDFARLVAYVPQAHHTPFPYTVRDVVLFGRTVHLNLFASPGKKDKMVADHALELLEVSYLADRHFTELSGGEKQMVIIARALAQEAKFMILDEPSSSLDYGNQIKVIKKINDLGKESIGILMATHSPDHAFMLGAKAIILNEGKVFGSGRPEEIVTPSSLKKIYGVNVQIFDTPANGTPSRKICAPNIYG
jgi:iron complex transport system ATP-binding protein